MSFIQHGQLQDVIDYRKLIEVHANTPVKVIASRNSSLNKGIHAKKITPKRKMLKR